MTTRTRLRRMWPDLALLAALLTVAASSTRLLGGGLGGVALGPLLLSATVGAAVPTVLALYRVTVPMRVLSGTIAVALASLWASAPGATTYGLPTGRTWGVLEADLRDARPVLAGFSVPLRPTEGIVLLACLLVGVVAVSASVALRADDQAPDRLYPCLALVSPFALLVFVTMESVRPSVALPIALFVGCSAALLSVSRPAATGGRSARGRSSWLSPTTVLTGVTVLAATLVALGLDGGGGGAAGSSPGGSSTVAVPPTGLSLTSTLVALEVHDANVTLFRAHSPIPTYWQVAVLTVLRNGEWTTDEDTAAALRGTQSGGASQTPSIGIGAGFAATVVVDHLSSRLLPVPPSTVAVSGAKGVVLSPIGAVTTAATEPGQRYTTTASAPVDDPGVLAGDLATSTYPPALLQAYTALPPLPSSLAALARDATAGAQTPIGEAEALVDWFRSGRFTYSLDPPATNPGADPIVSFLTTTRSGTCEQFAGAFTVLARTLGLPTRMVVGFTAGRRTGPDEVTIRGEDAHAWPEVYLGPAAGWVSFEPTPQKLTGEAAPEGVVGPTGVETTVPPPVTSPPSFPEPSSAPTVPTTAPPTTPSTAAPRGGSASSPSPASSGSSGPPWLPIVLGLLVLALLGVVAALRRRRWSPGGRSAVGLALLAEAVVDRALTEAGAPRPRWQPLSLFVADIADRYGRWWDDDTLGSLLVDAALVARVAEQALYDPDPTLPESARSAYAAALRVQRGLRGRDLRRAWPGSDRGAPLRV